jgi:Mg2+ and Co2+ transporter CorA
MTEQISHFLDTALAVVLGVFGWIGKKFADRLDKDEDRLTKIEVELAAQHERDVSAEKRMYGLEKNLTSINNKLDRLLELILGRSGPR